MYLFSAHFRHFVGNFVEILAEFDGLSQTYIASTKFPTKEREVNTASEPQTALVFLDRVRPIAPAVRQSTTSVPTPASVKISSSKA